LLDNPDAVTDLGQMPEAFYVPTALVVLSAHPFHNMNLRMLEEFVAIHCPSEIRPEHVDMLYSLLQLRLPSPGKTIELTIDSSLTGLSYSIPDLSAPPLCDVNFKILFRYLEPRHIITAFNALLSELPVLLTSQNIELLCSASEALLALLYPMKWPFLYIPVLPYSLVDVIQAPQPFLIGCHTSMLASQGPIPHVWLCSIARMTNLFFSVM
jgi:hypothetical protein